MRRTGTEPSHLRAAANLLLRSLGSGRRSPGEDFADSVARLAVEREGLRPSPVRLRRYLAATGGDRIGAFRGEAAVLPPFYPACWETALLLELLAGTAAGLPRSIVHLESARTLVRPLPVGEGARCRVEAEGVERTRRGARLRLRTRGWTGAGRLVSEGSMVLLLGGVEVPGRKDASPPGPVPVVERWEEVARWKLDGGAGRRYARGSGDYNPIHLWGWTARPFGFRRPILQGFCIEAMVANALVEHLWSGEAGALRRLETSFRAPLLLPARVSLQVGGEEGPRRFRVVDAGDGRVHAEGGYVGA